MCYGPEGDKDGQSGATRCTVLLLSHRVHVQSVHAQVEGRQVHALEDLLEGLASAVLDVDDLLGVLLHSSLDESQQVLLVHAGRRVDVCVHLERDPSLRRLDHFTTRPLLTDAHKRGVTCLAYVVKVSVGNLLLGCQLLHLVQQDVHLEFGAEVLQTAVAERLPGRVNRSTHTL